jgi:hypothetical protein
VMRLYWPKTDPPSILPPRWRDVAAAGHRGREVEEENR